VEYLKKYAPDIIIVVAFGQILTKNILDLPKYGCINVHASLLPKYRGAAPIQWAVINGDDITGVTTMRMDIGIDTGDMIAKREVRIAEDETGGSLFDKLSEVGAKLCVETMEMLEQGTAEFTPQNNEASTHVGMISKELGNIDWKKPAVEIERLIRGLNPWPSAYTHLNNKTFKIWKAEVVPMDGDFAPGCVAHIGKNEMIVATTDGALSLLEVQLEGKKRMDAGAFLRGYPVNEGTFLQE
jgi:methionyl-tRNA formyltransferase